MRCMHYLWSGQQKHINAVEVVKGRPARGSGYGGITHQKESIVISL